MSNFLLKFKKYRIYYYQKINYFLRYSLNKDSVFKGLISRIYPLLKDKMFSMFSIYLGKATSIQDSIEHFKSWKSEKIYTRFNASQLLLCNMFLQSQT